ncbi:hypothetical protein A2U01_0067457, partial [Trifolium medium]|nr:hypothetical protein [Trifolium medium]
PPLPSLPNSTTAASSSTTPACASFTAHSTTAEPFDLSSKDSPSQSTNAMYASTKDFARNCKSF